MVLDNSCDCDYVSTVFLLKKNPPIREVDYPRSYFQMFLPYMAILRKMFILTILFQLLR